MRTERIRREQFSAITMEDGDDEANPCEVTLEPLQALEYTPGYIYINWVAILGHLASVIGMLIIYLPRDAFGVPYTETFLAWERSETVTINGTNTSVCSGATRNTANDGEFCLLSKTETLKCGDDDCALDYGWLIISFHLLSFLFQLLAAATDYSETLRRLLCGYHYSEMIRRGKNPLRFIEYSISASIMLIIIAIINGIFDIHVLFAIGVLTCSCQLCGLVVEYLDDCQLGLMWMNHLNGWLTFCSAYYIIARAFFASVNYDPDIQPPDFVYAIVIAIFLLYASFGIVQLVELTCLTCPCGDSCTTGGNGEWTRIWCPACRTKVNGTLRCNPLYKEMVFVTLSLGAKLTLGWLLFTNVFMNT